MIRIFLIAGISFAVIGALAAQSSGPLNLFTDNFPAEKLKSTLQRTTPWQPYPTLANRAFWEQLDATTKQELIGRGEAALDYGWPPVSAALIMEFVRNGNRSNHSMLFSERRRALWDLMLAELVENKGRFVDQIANGVWNTCEETYWGFPAHTGLQRAGVGLPDIMQPTVDLFAAETGAYMAMVDYFIGPALDTVSPLLRPRIRQEVDRRIFEPIHRDEYGWMGFSKAGRPNNWNPWICSNLLLTTLLLEQNTDAQVRNVARVFQFLDNYLNPHPADGGCDEGPTYWTAAGASLFDNLEVLHDYTEGKIDFYQVPLIQKLGTYIYKVHIGKDYYVGFADAEPFMQLDGEFIYRFGEAIDDAGMRQFAGSLPNQEDDFTWGWHLSRKAYSFFNNPTIARAKPPFPRDAWFEDLQVLVARSQEGTDAGWFLAAKGGTNGESHNHNDVGNFMVFYDGLPVLIDVGRGTYTRRTFSGGRYNLWFNNSGYHNLPIINGQQQPPGVVYQARNVRPAITEKTSTLQLDIAPAYAEEVGVRRWERTIQLDRKKGLNLTEDYELGQQPEKIELAFMTHYPVQAEEKGVVTIKGKDRNFKLRFPAKIFTARVEKIAYSTPEDEGIRENWGDNIYRILLVADRPAAKGKWQVQFTN